MVPSFFSNLANKLFHSHQQKILIFKHTLSKVCFKFFFLQFFNFSWVNKQIWLAVQNRKMELHWPISFVSTFARRHSMFGSSQRNQIESKVLGTFGKTGFISSNTGSCNWLTRRRKKRRKNVPIIRHFCLVAKLVRAFGLQSFDKSHSLS